MYKATSKEIRFRDNQHFSELINECNGGDFSYMRILKKEISSLYKKVNIKKLRDVFLFWKLSTVSERKALLLILNGESMFSNADYSLFNELLSNNAKVTPNSIIYKRNGKSKLSNEELLLILIPFLNVVQNDKIFMDTIYTHRIRQHNVNVILGK